MFQFQPVYKESRIFFANRNLRLLFEVCQEYLSLT